MNNGCKNTKDIWFVKFFCVKIDFLRTFAKYFQ
jgi:hypothetical protein